MIKLSEALPFQKLPRVAAYAALAAFVTAILFAADGAYRWYRDTDTQAAAPATHEQSVALPTPASIEAQHASPQSQTLAGLPERHVMEIENRTEDQPATARIPDTAIGSVATPSGAPIPVPASRPVEAVPQQGQPKLSQNPKRQQARRLPAKQEVRATARRPVAAEKPNVYWERETQLGFAPQLRKRTCNPATGHMPMQCYYPREGRERFPAKPLEYSADPYR